MWASESVFYQIYPLNHLISVLFLFFCKRKAGGRFGTTPGQNMQCGAGFTGSAKHCPAPGLHLPGS